MRGGGATRALRVGLNYGTNEQKVLLTLGESESITEVLVSAADWLGLGRADGSWSAGFWQEHTNSTGILDLLVQPGCNSAGDAGGELASGDAKSLFV